MDRAAEINALGAAARDAFEDRHRAREITIAASRGAIQACAKSIRASHRGEHDAAADLAREAQDRIPDVFQGKLFIALRKQPI